MWFIINFHIHCKTRKMPLDIVRRIIKRNINSLEFSTIKQSIFLPSVSLKTNTYILKKHFRKKFFWFLSFSEIFWRNFYWAFIKFLSLLSLWNIRLLNDMYLKVNIFSCITKFIQVRETESWYVCDNIYSCSYV